MKRILIVKTSAGGDVIQTLPVLDYLRRRFPHSTIDWVVEKGWSDLIAAHPEIHRVIILSTKKWRRALLCRETWKEIAGAVRALRQEKYDLVIDFQGNSKSGLFTFLARGKEKVGFNWRSAPELPNLLATRKRYGVSKELPASQRYLSLAQAHFGDGEPFLPQGRPLRLSDEEERRLARLVAGSSSRCMVAFASRWVNKRLPEPTLIAFLQKIQSQYAFQLFFPYGNEEERKEAERLARQFEGVAVGEMSMPFWQALIAKMECLIAMDSAALHLCATTATPSFSLFGPSSSTVYRPLDGERHYALQGQCPYGVSFTVRCPKLRTCPTGACLRSLKADDLAIAFSQWLEGVSQSRCAVPPQRLLP